MKHHAPFSKTIVLLAVFFFAIATNTAANAASNTNETLSPTNVVEHFHAILLSVMKEADTLGLNGRFKRLQPEIEQAFDLSRMIRVACGKFWKQANPDQRQSLLSAFKRISVTTYATQFDGYSGEKFTTVGEKPGPQKTVLVETKILRPEDDAIGMTYVMKKSNNQWRITDVLLDNSISELAVRRSEYKMVLETSGIEGLISILNNKANALRQPDPK